jgi:hypothetical protein
MIYLNQPKEIAMATFFVDGDKGGVGKSWMARALADYLMTSRHCGKLVIIDCDPSNPDVVGENSYTSETAEGVEIIAHRFPITSADDWPAVIDFVIGNMKSSDADCVFSLPAGAGLHIDAETIQMQELLTPALTVWVMGTDQSSIEQLEHRVERSETFYSKGIVALNSYHGQLEKGAFAKWNESLLYRMLGWPEIVIPRMNPFGTSVIGTMPFHRVLREGSNLSPTIPIIINGFRRQLHPQLDKAFEALGI